MEVATKEAGKTRTKVIELNKQGIIGADHQSLQLHETTRTESTASKKVELSLNIGKLEYPIDSLASRIDFFQYDYLINSSRPTTPSTMARPNLSSGSGYILNQSS
jgi:hypothetical protein